MGFSHQGVTKLYPEEAAFLISRSALVVENEQGEELGFQDFCEILCDPDTDGWISFDKYQVYAYLKRLGYIVLRSKQRSTLPPSPAPMEENSSSNISLWKLFFDKISYWIYKDQTIPLVWNYKYTNYRKCFYILSKSSKHYVTNRKLQQALFILHYKSYLLHHGTSHFIIVYTGHLIGMFISQGLIGKGKIPVCLIFKL